MVFIVFRQLNILILLYIQTTGTVVRAIAEGTLSASLTDDSLSGIYTADPEVVNPITFQFGLYVDGHNGSTVDGGTISGNFTVSLAHRL